MIIQLGGMNGTINIWSVSSRVFRIFQYPAMIKVGKILIYRVIAVKY